MSFIFVTGLFLSVHMISYNLVLETVTGKFVDVIEPLQEQIDINDIAWGLSRLPRFAGHTITAVPYNVAQHSLLVTEIVSDLFLDDYGKSTPETKEAVESLQQKAIIDEQTFMRLRLKALLHDSAEVYTGDIPSPVKRHPQIYPAIKDLELKLTTCIFKRFCLSPMTEDEEIVIHFADMVARAIEAHAFMHSRGHGWDLPPVSLLRLQKFEPPMTSVVAYESFLEKFYELY